MSTTTLPPSPCSRKRSVAWLQEQVCLLGGRKIALWPETRRQLVRNLRRDEPRSTRFPGPRAQLLAEVRAEVLLEAAIAEAEAAGAVVVRDVGPFPVIEIAETQPPAETPPADETPSPGADAGVEPAPLQWA